MYKFLIVDTYYSDFLTGFYKKNDTEKEPYARHLQILLDEFFGTADFYSRNLRAIGYPAQDVIFNDMRLQYKWFKEYGRGRRIDLFRNLDVLHKILNKAAFVPWDWQAPYTILKAQIEHYQPDILYIQDIGAINDRFLAQIKPQVKLIAGQIACPLPADRDLKVYDVIFTSFPHYVDILKKMGVSAQYLKIGFEPRIWESLGKETLSKKYDCIFIGGFSKPHSQRVKSLEAAAERLALDVWGYGIERLASSSSLRKRYHGEAWGRDMYRVLGQSKISINIHIDAAADYANNMRLYESTGMGSLLVTDYKKNLNDLFKVGAEIIAYKTVDELCSAVEYYLDHEKERAAIAVVGQQRTLREHGYGARMKELAGLLKPYME